MATKGRIAPTETNASGTPPIATRRGARSEPTANAAIGAPREVRNARQQVRPSHALEQRAARDVECRTCTSGNRDQDEGTERAGKRRETHESSAPDADREHERQASRVNPTRRAVTTIATTLPAPKAALR